MQGTCLLVGFALCAVSGALLFLAGRAAAGMRLPSPPAAAAAVLVAPPFPPVLLLLMAAPLALGTATTAVVLVALRPVSFL
jgi:hypothetical protein